MFFNLFFFLEVYSAKFIALLLEAREQFVETPNTFTSSVLHKFCKDIMQTKDYIIK